MIKIIILLFIGLNSLLANDGLYDYTFGVDSYQNADYLASEIAFANSCSKSYAEGCNALGYMYENGKGVRKNYNQALRYYTKSCDLKNAKGCYQLALLFDQKPNNHFKVEQILNEACNYGYIKACK